MRVQSNTNFSPNIQIGIDLGGTKIEIIALDSRGNALVRRRIPTPNSGYANIVNALTRLIKETAQELGIQPSSIGIGIPGALSKKTGLIKNANTTALIGHALDQDLSQQLGCPVTLENDANCFALSEAMDGAGAPFKNVFAVILGTGVGGGVSINKQLLCGPNAITGEWGHNPLPWSTHADQPKQPCYCGLSGCIETYLSGPGMAQQAKLQHHDLLTSTTSHQLLDKTRYPDIYHQYVNRLARSLASVINILDPDAIVLGGGLSNVSTLYEDIPLCWQPYVFSDHVDTLLLKNQHGDSSGVRGAAWLNSLRFD